MEDYGYAHYDTSKGERRTATAALNRPRISAELQLLRASAFERKIPTADDETLAFLIAQVRATGCKNILELGTATGISAIAMATACPSATITTIEKDKLFFEEARKNFALFGVAERINAINADACDALAALPVGYDFVFMDCAKAQYIKYLPKIKRLLARGGVLLADDVLLFGWVAGEVEIPKKRAMLARHVSEYVQAVTSDDELCTAIINVGDGLAMSVKL